MNQASLLVPSQRPAGLVSQVHFQHQALKSSSKPDLSAVGVPFGARNGIHGSNRGLMRQASRFAPLSLHQSTSCGTFGPQRPVSLPACTRLESPGFHSTPPYSPTIWSDDDQSYDYGDEEGVSPALPWPMAYGDQATMMAYAAMRQGPGALHLFNSGMECFTVKGNNDHSPGRKPEISPKYGQPMLGIAPKKFASWATGCGTCNSFSDFVAQERDHSKRTGATVNYPGAPFLTKTRRKFSPEARLVTPRREGFVGDPDDDTEDLDLETSLVRPSFNATRLAHRQGGASPFQLPKSHTAPTLRRCKVRFGEVSFKDMTPIASSASSSAAIDETCMLKELEKNNKKGWKTKIKKQWQKMKWH